MTAEIAQDQHQTDSPVENKNPRLQVLSGAENFNETIEEYRTHLYELIDQLEIELADIEKLLLQRVQRSEPSHSGSRDGLIPRRSVDEYQRPHRRRVVIQNKLLAIANELQAIEHTSEEVGSVATRQIAHVAVE